MWTSSAHIDVPTTRVLPEGGVCKTRFVLGTKRPMCRTPNPVPSASGRSFIKLTSVHLRTSWHHTRTTRRPGFSYTLHPTPFAPQAAAEDSASLEPDEGVWDRPSSHQTYQVYMLSVSRRSRHISTYTSCSNVSHDIILKHCHIYA